jgi:hypothetical protein
MMAPATYSLHCPTNVKPRDNAAKALSYKDKSVLIMVEIKIYCNYVFDLPA